MPSHLLTGPLSDVARGRQLSSAAELRAGAWSPFRLVSFAGYEAGAADANIYYMNVQANPIGRGLVALLPLAHRGRGCVGFAASRDGRRWSAIAPLLPSDLDVPDRARTAAQPVAGLLRRRGGGVALFVHENVAGIVERTRRFRATLRAVPPNASADGLPVALDAHASRLVRYDVPANAFAEWVRKGLATLEE